MMLYLCAVMANRTYQKITAAALLVCLLFTTIVQLTHSHPGKKNAVTHLTKTTKPQGKENWTVAGADTRCFLCEYQLTRDSDIPVTTFHFSYTNKVPVTTAVYCDSVSAVFISCFESRGPPASAAI